jgi:lactate racemase
MLIGKAFTDRFLTEDEARAVLIEGLGQLDLVGRSVLLIMPDSTRSGPFGLCFRTLADEMLGRVARLDVLIALGTHAPMDEAHICDHLGIAPEERAGRYADVGLLNHDFLHDLRTIGVISAAEIEALSGGLMSEELPVQVNARLFDYDQLIICGPVFPHEIVGFSGGNKYFFPGVSGPEVIDLTHWLGAVIGNREIIGHQDTPVRKVVDRAAALIDRPKACFSLVVRGHDDLAGLFFGTPEEAQSAAAEISALVNIRWVEHPYHTVISVMPELYDDIWTAGKGMYKMEPVVADGGTVIIYAPHIDEVSYTHGALLDRIGYHVRDYFLAHMDRYQGVSRGVMAHATHVKGAGTYVNGVERPRVNVVLATGVPRERCERINLGYLDPDGLDLSEWVDREDEGILVVPRAGEMLYRLVGERELEE